MAAFKDIIQNAYHKFRDDITYGIYKPGMRLSERILTERYSVSRSSLRAIIGQLVSQGYLVVERNRGAMVTKLSLEDIDVIYNILVRCESYAAYLFTKRKDAASIKKLVLTHEKMKMDHVRHTSKTWLELNNQFHEFIYSNCGSNILRELIYHTRQRIYRFRMAMTDIENIIVYSDHHDRILKAIQKGNPEEAEKLMVLHLNQSRINRMKAFKEIEELLRFGKE